MRRLFHSIVEITYKDHILNVLKMFLQCVLFFFLLLNLSTWKSQKKSKLVFLISTIIKKKLTVMFVFI